MTLRPFLALLIPALFAPALAAPLLAAGQSPADPIVWNVEGSPVALSFPSYSTTIWFRVSPRAMVQSSHFEVRTAGTLDTRLSAYANLADAIADRPFASDDDSGEGWNAYIKAPIGFSGPYLIKARAWSSGTSSMSGNLTAVTAAVRCSWPDGCTLATAAEGAATGAGALRTLRAVRDEILTLTPRGREVESLYWRLGRDLVPALFLSSELRAQVFARVEKLLPLADAALGEVRQAGTGRRLEASEVEQLADLMTLLRPHLEAASVAALDRLWQDLSLEAQAGKRLGEVLQESGLAIGTSRPVTLLVKLRESPTLKSGALATGIPGVDSLLASHPVHQLRRVHIDIPENRQAGLATTVAIEVESGTEASLLERLQASFEVEWAEVNGEVRISANTADPYSSQLWGLDAVKAPAVWGSGTGSCSTPVAIVDTGLRPDLIDFAGRILPGRGWDFANDDNDPLDLHGHGTHVAGTIAANANNSVSIAGVAPTICFFAVKVLSDAGSGTMEDVAAGIVHAANQGAKIINMSLGCDGTDSRCFSNAVEDAMAYAAGRDVLIVAAAGNDGIGTLSYPASSPWALSVGAVDSQLSRADFSNYGTNLDLVAPGVDVASVFTDGESCLGSGTSMAAPHVTGVAALLRSARPAWSRNQVTQTLLQAARDLGDPGFDAFYGHGLVDATAALPPVDPCTGNLCLQNRRFAVRMVWRDFNGNTGVGKLAPISSSSSGLFWFFDAKNWEVLVKVLDGCSVNGRFWVYAAATTDVEYTLYVTDTSTGATRTYFNPLGVAAAAITDADAFATCSAAAPIEVPRHVGDLLAAEPLSSDSSEILSQSVAGSDVATAATCDTSEICLNQSRFKVEVSWRDFQNQTGRGSKVTGGVAGDSALLWFFDAANWEILVKVLNGCALNGRYWVFAAATTNVEYTLRVTDTQTGGVREYRNALGRSAPAVTDTLAFACN